MENNNLTVIRVSCQSDDYDDLYNRDQVDINNRKMAEEELYQLFLSSPYFEKYEKNVKVEKGDMYEVFYFFRDKMISLNRYSMLEIFIVIAEFFDMNYNILYPIVNVKDKERLLEDMKHTTSMQKYIKSLKLF